MRINADNKEASISNYEINPELQDVEGIGPTIAKKLKEARITSVMDLAVTSAEQLAVDINSSKDSAAAFIMAAQKLLRESNVLEKEFVTADFVLEKRKSMLRCSTGSKSLDELLLGGIETQAVTEFYGEFGSGKSQICHTLCAMAKQPINEGGLDGGVIYIDTEGTFRPERLQQIAESRGFVLLEVLKKVSVCKVYNSSHLELIIKDLGKYINEFNAKLVIIDSIISLHRAEFIGRGTLADRQQKLNSILHKLVRVAEIFNIAIVITNQVLSSPDTFFGDPTKAAGGNVIGHTSTYRIYLRKSGENRIAKMIDSPYHPYSDIRITVKGIDDLEDSTTREKRRRLRLTLAEYESEPEIEDLANPNDELRKKIVTLADTVREWNNETNRIRKTVKEQFEEILTLGLHKYNMEKTDLRRLVEEIFLIHGVNESYLRKLLPAKLKDPSKTRISYLQRQNIEKERQRLLQQKGFRIPAEIRN